jgi:hypothetical protein
MIRTTVFLAFALLLIPSPGAAQSNQTVAQYNRSMADMKASCRSEIQKMIKIGMAHPEGGTAASVRQALLEWVDREILPQLAKTSRQDLKVGMRELTKGEGPFGPIRGPTAICFAKRRLAQLDGAKLIH